MLRHGSLHRLKLLSQLKHNFPGPRVVPIPKLNHSQYKFLPTGQNSGHCAPGLDPCLMVGPVSTSLDSASLGILRKSVVEALALILNRSGVERYRLSAFLGPRNIHEPTVSLAKLSAIDLHRFANT